MQSIKASKLSRKLFGMSSLFVALLWCSKAMAADDLTAIASNLYTNIEALGPVLSIVAYIAGIGFCIAGIVQFKAHKDNPAQVPLSKPMVYLGVGAALLFLPTLIETAGQTIFSGSQTGSRAGSDMEGL